MLLKAFHLPCQELIDYAYYMLTIRLLPGMDYTLISLKKRFKSLVDPNKGVKKCWRLGVCIGTSCQVKV